MRRALFRRSSDGNCCFCKKRAFSFLLVSFLCGEFTSKKYCAHLSTFVSVFCEEESTQMSTIQMNLSSNGIALVHFIMLNAYTPCARHVFIALQCCAQIGRPFNTRLLMHERVLSIEERLLRARPPLLQRITSMQRDIMNRSLTAQQRCARNDRD